MATNLEAAAAPDVLLGDFLVDMRSWLDNRHIETVGFAKGQFEVRFRRTDDARRFERRFA
jgi:hypothetical protein